jgi:hypothetical protein
MMETAPIKVGVSRAASRQTSSARLLYIRLCTNSIVNDYLEKSNSFSEKIGNFLN